MKNILTTSLAILPLVLLSCKKEEPEHSWLSGNEYERIETVSTHLRGNDVVMWEVEFRHKKLWDAIITGNDEYAQYQLKKIELTMRQGMERRPKRRESYEWFFKTAIPPMTKALEDGKGKEAYKVFSSHCATCHAMEKVPHMPVATPWASDEE